MDRQGRNGAIDMLRGLVMFLMVTVNDFWKVLDVPHFLEHFATHEDGMGVSDIVFPMFLFVMGMSIPYALDRRCSRGDAGESVLGHILSRTLALLLMGTFIVNAEGGDIAPLTGYGKGLYWLLMVVGFFLVWNAYPKGWRPAWWLRGAGVAVLLFLAFTFRTADGHFFQARWWGILGMIGWTYLFTAVAYLLARKKPGVMVVLWAAVLLLNLFTAPLREGGPILPRGNFISDFANALHIGNGHCALMSLGGCVLSLACRKFAPCKRSVQVAIGICSVLLLLLGGFLSHRIQIISKNLGTLPWCLYVSAISVTAYLLLRMLEKRGWTRWFAPFRPAGTATLTVYMIPYLLVSLWIFMEPTIPAWLSGWVGVLKCMAVAFLCIGITALLGKVGIKLKV